jgi:predicted signal transduction protein with EAL and GGDEF domain
MSHADIHALGVRICEALEAPFLLADITVEISGSIGFAAFPQAGATAALLFERAAYSLTHAKENERGRSISFQSSATLKSAR